MLLERLVMKTPGFRNSAAAGRALAPMLAQYKSSNPVVVGLTRGGVPVAFEVARALGAPLDICIVRKIGAPTQPEFGLGAVAEGGVVLIDDESAAAVGATAADLDVLVAEKQVEIASRVRRYRRGKPPIDLRGRTVIVVDDGLATGGTARVAVRAMRQRGARHVILAVPIAAADTLSTLRYEADEVICPVAPHDFRSVGVWYGDFRATSDDEVIEMLDGACEPATDAAPNRLEHV